MQSLFDYLNSLFPHTNTDLIWAMVRSIFGPLVDPHASATPFSSVIVALNALAMAIFFPLLAWHFTHGLLHSAARGEPGKKTYLHHGAIARVCAGMVLIAPIGLLGGYNAAQRIVIAAAMAANDAGANLWNAALATLTLTGNSIPTPTVQSPEGNAALSILSSLTCQIVIQDVMGRTNPGVTYFPQIYTQRQTSDNKMLFSFGSPVLGKDICGSFLVDFNPTLSVQANAQQARDWSFQGIANGIGLGNFFSPNPNNLGQGSSQTQANTVVSTLATEAYQAQVDATNSMIGRLVPIAQQLALYSSNKPWVSQNPPPLPSGSDFQQIVDDFRSEVRDGISAAIARAVSADQNAGVMVMQDTAQRYGWITMGTMVTTLTEAQGQIRKAAIFSVVATPPNLSAACKKSDAYLCKTMKIFAADIMDWYGKNVAESAPFASYQAFLSGQEGPFGNAIDARGQYAAPEQDSAVADHLGQMIVDLFKPSDLAIDPFGAMISTGHAYLSLGSKLAIGNVALSILGPFGAQISTLIDRVAGILIVVGVMLAYFVPLSIFLRVGFAALGWIILLVEVVIAAPLFCVMLVTPIADESDMLTESHTAHGINIGIHLMLKPILVVLGFVAYLAVFTSVVNVFVLLDQISMASAGHGQLGGPITLTIEVVIFFGLLTVLNERCLELVGEVPERVCAWLGVRAPQDEVERSGVGRAARELTSASTLAVAPAMAVGTARAAQAGRDAARGVVQGGAKLADGMIPHSARALAGGGGGGPGGPNGAGGGGSGPGGGPNGGPPAGAAGAVANAAGVARAAGATARQTSVGASTSSGSAPSQGGSAPGGSSGASGGSGEAAAATGDPGGSSGSGVNPPTAQTTPAAQDPIAAGFTGLHRQRRMQAAIAAQRKQMSEAIVNAAVKFRRCGEVNFPSLSAGDQPVM